jgi:hypothetical protein
LFDPDGYWTPSFAALVLAKAGAQGKLPLDWGFVPDGQSMDILDLPNEVTAAHLIGSKLAAGKVRGWARDVRKGDWKLIPARCWGINLSLRNIFKVDSVGQLSVSMSQVGYPGLEFDSPAEVFINADELLACLEVRFVDGSADNSTCQESDQTDPEASAIVGSSPAPARTNTLPRKTGTAGRPTKSKELLICEMRRRASRGELLAKLSHECVALIAWLHSNHPGAPCPKETSLKNSLRKDFQVLSAENVDPLRADCGPKSRHKIGH